MSEENIVIEIEEPKKSYEQIIEEILIESNKIINSETKPNEINKPRKKKTYKFKD